MSDVLIVEDETLVALAAEMALEDAGHTVVGIARTAHEAVELARRHLPDILIADLRLKDGSRGEDAVERVRAEMDVAVIFTSGNLDPSRREILRAVNPVAMIVKPYADDQLIDAVSRAA